MSTEYEVQYSSNNSGGSWWLTDQDWYDLEKAGWKVEWIKDRADEFALRPDKDGRFLGSLAVYAKKVFTANSEASAEDKAVADWTDITGQSASEQGCNCCGQPHSFWVEKVEPE